MITNSSKNLYTGILSTTGKGTGFLAIEDSPFVDDILIEPGNTGLALHGDEVEIEILPEKDGERRSGKVVQVITKTNREFVGTVEKKQTVAFVKLDNYKVHKDIFLPGNQMDKVSDGDKIVVKIIRFDDPTKSPMGEVVKVLGKKGDHETEMQAILIDKSIDTDFPIQVDREAELIANNREELFAEALADKHRRDVRDLVVLTIDPADAKDFDDALSIEWLGATGDTKHVRIGVHIADVSYFVNPKSALDQEAFQRSFSTYLVDRTVPMLPEVLSNDLCSLIPNTDRLAFSGFFELKDHQVVSAEFTKTIIHSDFRFSYEEAQDLIENKNTQIGSKYKEQIQALNKIALDMKAVRVKAGAIEFGDDEVKFELDALMKPIAVHKRERKEAHKMVEEFMLMCNKHAAIWFGNKSKQLGAQALSVFRVHDYPNVDKLKELNDFVQILGYPGLAKEDLNTDRVAHKTIQKLLVSVAETPAEDLVSNQMLRAMAKAAYSTIDKGHFGLAFENYLHFTSPIRRYPDLLVHRSMDTYLRGELPPKNDVGYYANSAKQSSEREIQTVDAERTSIAYKQVEYLQSKVDQEFDAIISGVSQYGFFVEEITTKAQGLVRSKTIANDFYDFDPKRYALVGQKTGRKFTIGDPIKVKLAGADLDRRQLDFELVDN